MGRILGDATNPRYELDNGTILELRPLTQLAFTRYMQEWKRANPEPLPPEYVMSNGETGQDTSNARYLAQHAVWQEAFTSSQIEFVFKYGVVNEPPSDFVPYLPIFEHDRKLNWLYSILPNSELEEGALTNAIMGIANATTEGVEQAEKN